MLIVLIEIMDKTKSKTVELKSSFNLEAEAELRRQTDRQTLFSDLYYNMIIKEVCVTAAPLI